MKIKRKFKENLALLVAVVLVLQLMTPGMVYAESYTNPDLGDTYTYSIDDGKATITGFTLAEDNTSVSIPSTLDGYPVTKIGNGAFGWKDLESVTIPNTVIEIADDAFNHNNLSDVTIPENVTSIGARAFKDNMLTEVIISDSVTLIGNNAFENNCLSEFTIPDSVLSIGKSAFAYNSLTEVTFPESVMFIDDNAFDKNGLTKVTINNRDTTFGLDVFYGQTHFMTLTVYGYSDSSAELYATSYNYNFQPLDGGEASTPDDDIAAALAALDETDITFGGTDTLTTITQNFTLPLLGENSTTITWAEAVDNSNCLAINATTGIVTVTRLTSSDAIGALRATISKTEGADVTKDFEFKILQDEDGGEVIAVPTGVGSAEDPYLISSADDLAWMSLKNAENVGFSGKYFKQTADIDMSAVENFTPIGDSDNSFEGSYDGNGKTIANLVITGSIASAGLFGSIGDAGEVKSLTLEAADITITDVVDATAGGIVGFNLGTISDCHVDITSSISVGGTGDISIGGIVGANNGTISQCSNVAEIQMIQSDSAFTGGIVGYNESGMIENCFNTGNINNADIEDDVFGVCSGGIAGVNEDGSIEYCYNTGIIMYGGVGGVKGGIAGASLGITTGCFFWIDSAATGYNIMTGDHQVSPSIDEATPMSLVDLQTPTPFTDWDTNIWAFNSGSLPGLISMVADDEVADGVDTDEDGNTYSYTDNGDGTATITNFTSGGLIDIEIPSTVDGLTVTIIDGAAFKEKNLASVVIPESVTEIGESTFEDNMLSSISIPKNVKSIGDSAFCNQYFYDEDEDEDVTTLSVVEFAEESALESLGMCAFSNNIIKEVVLPEGLKTIGNFAFDVNKLAEITIPASVISIGNNAFSENQLNKAIILGNSTTIGTDAFALNPDELAIFGYADSTAYDYTDSNNLKFACIPSGDGSQENPYEIKNAVNLVWMSSENSDFSGKYFIQTDDIDMSDMSDFVSIGEYTAPFKGKYDGKSYKISDLQITSDKMFTGLFGYIGSSGEVKRVTLVDASIDSTYDSNQPGGIGGIAGGNSGTILDCHVTRSEGNESVISSNGQNAIIGGIVGDNSGTISRCSNNADVKAFGGTNGMYAIGGIAGSNNRIIEDCFNLGDVSDVDGKAALIYLGGIAGSNGDTINHCFSTGTIDTSYEYASKGGVVGTSTSFSASKITDNYYLDGTAANGIGAMGFNPGTSVGAVSKESDALKDPETFSDWDTEKWNFSEDNLPGLKPVLDENDTTEEKSAPEINVSDSAVDIDSETMGLSFESSEAWIKKLNGAVITLDGLASPVEGTSKWTIDAEKIGIMTGNPNENFDDYYLRADGVSNTQMYIKFQIGEKPENRICKTGNYTLILKADGYPDATVSFNISSGNFTGVKVITQPSNITSGGNVGTVKVARVDQFGNTISNVKGKVFSDVTASAKNGAFTIGGVTTASFDENGVATFSGITATKAEGLSGATLRFSTSESYLFMGPALQAGKIEPETHTCDSAAFNISALAPSNNEVETQPLPKKEDKMSVVVEGKTQDNAATVTTTTGKDGQTTTTVALDKDKITETLEKMSKKTNDEAKPMISIPINNDSDKVVGELNGQIVKSMEDKEVVLEIKTASATYTLPSGEINIATVSESLGENLTLSDIKVQIEISKPDAATVKVVEDTANKGGYTLVASPVEFTISCSYGDKSVEVSKFNSFVERTVAIPDGVDPSKITTGVVIALDGTVRHVPTRIIVIDGKYFAQINSLTNSTYSVIWHPKEFKDVENHWAKGAINDMGSRMVINGTDSENFDPNRDITRAEFAAIIVRALGLKPETSNMTFTDVKPTDWYSDYVLTAAEYNIVSGYENGQFSPDEKLTREQAMSMIARAMKVTKLNVELSEVELENLMRSFSDSDEVANYANSNIAECIKAGIVTGRDSSSLAPKANITRAEVAVIIRNLLLKSSLI